MKIEVLGSIEFEVVVVVVKIESWQYVDDNDIVVVVEKCCGCWKVLWSSGEERPVTMVVGNILGKIATIV